jgi:hypothetical protein
MKLKVFILTFSSSVPIVGTSKQMQGFFTEKFPELEWFSQHDGKKYKFRYPLVQHKMINGPMIVGIKNGIDDMEKMYDQFKSVKFGDNSYNVLQKHIHIDEYEFGISDKIHTYRFATPLMALDKENNKKYKSLKGGKEVELSLAKRINTYIVDHMSKQLGYDVPERLKTDFKLAGVREIPFEGQYMKIFYGDFRTNFKIPNYLSIGKAKSIGFGTVVEIDIKDKGPPE